MKGQPFVVKDVKKKEKNRYPDAPFITSTLQQESFNKLKYNATKTMILAQQLYEGVDIGQDAPVGLITYMRTDSTKVADEAIKEVREMIGKSFGKDFLPETPNVYKVKKLAQEAHEAVRPTLISQLPGTLEKYLTPEQYKLYELIYTRFVASQMTPARSLLTTVEIKVDKNLFGVSGSVPIFDGFTAVYSKEGAETKKRRFCLNWKLARPWICWDWSIRSILLSRLPDIPTVLWLRLWKRRHWPALHLCADHFHFDPAGLCAQG